MDYLLCRVRHGLEIDEGWVKDDFEIGYWWLSNSLRII